MFVFFIISFLMSVHQVYAFSLSADEMYRGLLTYENNAPPDIIVNRKAPEIDPFKEDTTIIKKDTEKEKENKNEKVRNKELEDTYQKIVEQKEAAEKEKWNKAVRAVQKNQATAFDIETIKQKANLEDAEAIELLAWMYTTGTGVPQNLINAYDLYLKASLLGVKDADKNAALVLKNMPVSERRKIPNFAD